MKVHLAPIVKELNSYYGDILYPNASDTIYTHLSLLAAKMHEGLNLKEPCLYAQLNNYNPHYLGNKIDFLRAKEFDLSDCQHTIANEYGFHTWEKVIALDKTNYNLDFEKCVNHIIKGNIEALKTIIEANPNLVHLHSQYGHKATLLHYTASNGVELWRQQVPQNLPEIIKFMIEYGSDKNAKMNVYGGLFTAYELFVSSAHPYEAGLDKSTADLLSI